MVRLSTALGLLCIAASAAAQETSTSTNPFPSPSPSPLTLQITTKSGTRNKTAPLLHGLFFEDINHSGDGGIYAELIRNRAFQGSDVRYGRVDGQRGSRIVESENRQVPWGPTLTAWRPIGGAVLSLDVLNPLSDALRTVLRVDIPTDATGEVGFLNEGWWGIDVEPHPYDVSFYLKPSGALYTGNVTGITASLRSNLTDDIFAERRIAFDGRRRLSTTSYTQFETVLTPKRAAPSSNNTFAVTFDGREAAGNSFFFSLISVFPPTYKGRANGLRKDLAEHLADIKPKFLRFPGGNNLEGLSIDTRWQWKKNIGPLIDRAGRPGNWGYYNTDGLGYLEYLQWCEDMEIEPLLTVYAGYSLDYADVHPANTVPEEEMGFYIDEAIDQLEYAMGGLDTKWGALRAKHGHPKPFSIKYVEIGNEDWFSDSYYWRFPMFLEALHRSHPNITYIASQATENSPANRNTTIPAGAMWDLHHYETPQFFKDRFNFFDNWQKTTGYEGVQIFVGEYSVLSRDRVGGVDWANGEGRFTYPTTIAAIGEAIFGLAMERNPNVVALSSYAPLFQNFNAYQWTPDFIGFAADPRATVLSASYHMQRMFSRHKGSETLPVRNTRGGFNPVWWHASIEAKETGRHAGGRIFVKLVNAAKSPAPVTLQLDIEIAAANGTVLGNADEYAFNDPSNASAISPERFTLKRGRGRGFGKTLEYEIPPLSIVVLELR